MLIAKEIIVDGILENVEESVVAIESKIYADDLQEIIIDQFMNDVLDDSKEDMQTVVLAHNLKGYDGLFILNWLEKRGWNYQKIMSNCGNR